MSQASELLENLAAEPNIASNSPHADAVIVDIDRTIIAPDHIKKLGVQYDHNANVINFYCPRYFGDVDIAKMKIYVNYMRADGVLGMALCENVTLDPMDLSLIRFEWVVSGHVTEVSGNISFLVCAKKVNKVTGEEETHWNSELCNDFYVSTGLKCKETVLKKHPDIITQLLLRMELCEKTVRPEEYLAVLEAIKGFQNDVNTAKNAAVESAKAATNASNVADWAAKNVTEVAIEVAGVKNKVSMLDNMNAISTDLPTNVTTTAEAINYMCSNVWTEKLGAYHGRFKTTNGDRYSYYAFWDGETTWSGLLTKETDPITYSFYKTGGKNPALTRIDNNQIAIIASYADLMANTKSGYHTDALAVKEAINAVKSEMAEMESNFQDGCSGIAAVITEMGVTTASNASLEVVKDNIRKIKTPVDELIVAGGESFTYTASEDEDVLIIYHCVGRRNGEGHNATYLQYIITVAGVQKLNWKMDGKEEYKFSGTNGTIVAKLTKGQKIVVTMTQDGFESRNVYTRIIKT